MSESRIFQAAKTLRESAVAHRRQIHRNPELAFEETNTSAYAAGVLESLGFNITRGYAKTGLVAELFTGKSGPRYMLRFDMDALAVQEQSGVAFASTRPGLMHACGHDGHVAIGLTVARLIADLKGELCGSYHLLFQPAEETGEGAAAMIAEGVLDFIRPDYALAVHLWPEEPIGWLGISPGPVMAGCKAVSFHVKGVGGHGGKPQKAVDSILASAHLITALQSIVSRKLDPLDSGVYSLTQIHAGSNNNVIPDRVFINGKPRFFTPEAKEIIYASTTQICEGIVQAFGCEIEIELGKEILPAVNDAAVFAAAYRAAMLLGPLYENNEKFKTMVSEDMALFLEKIPGALLFVGAGSMDPTKRYPLHHPCMDIDEDCLVHASALLLETCQQLAVNKQ